MGMCHHAWQTDVGTQEVVYFLINVTINFDPNIVEIKVRMKTALLCMECSCP